MGWDDYPPYVPVAVRRANALREVQKMARKGMRVSPVKIDGRAIASTFWGKAWCENLESYSDFSNRLPRGRTYVRNGSVVHLQIEPGKITSLVSGSSLYRIAIEIRPLAAPRWKKLKAHCGSQIGSLVELLQGRLSKGVMEIVTGHEDGLFPAPREIEMSCSCPDWAGMCKHIAATLYAVGNRLDHEPELFFKLRQVDHLELIAQAGSLEAKPKTTGRKRIGSDQLADVFGIELETAPAPSAPAAPAKPARAKKPALPKSSAPPKRKEPERGSAEKRNGIKPYGSAQDGKSKRATITAAARKRIAQLQKERWETLRSRLSKAAAVVQAPPVPVKEMSKTRPAQSTGNKPGRRTRQRATAV